MAGGRPVYLQQTSSGPGTWQQTNWARTGQFQIAFAGVSTGGATWHIDVTLDDPFSIPIGGRQTGPYPPLNPNAPAVFGSSLASNGGAIIGSTTGAANTNIGYITMPIAAWRLTVDAAAGPVYLTAFEMGIG
jgi:hypothetical protein